MRPSLPTIAIMSDIPVKAVRKNEALSFFAYDCSGKHFQGRKLATCRRLFPLPSLAKHSGNNIRLEERTSLDGRRWKPSKVPPDDNLMLDLT